MRAGYLSAVRCKCFAFGPSDAVTPHHPLLY